jgi:hypothetical protein
VKEKEKSSIDTIEVWFKNVDVAHRVDEYCFNDFSWQCNGQEYNIFPLYFQRFGAWIIHSGKNNVKLLVLFKCLWAKNYSGIIFCCRY